MIFTKNLYKKKRKCFLLTLYFQGEEKASQRRPSLPDIAVLDQLGACEK